MISRRSFSALLGGAAALAVVKPAAAAPSFDARAKLRQYLAIQRAGFLTSDEVRLIEQSGRRSFRDTFDALDRRHHGPRRAP